LQSQKKTEPKNNGKNTKRTNKHSTAKYLTTQPHKQIQDNIWEKLEYDKQENKKWKCIINNCNKKYSTKTTLTKHIYQKHMNHLPAEPKQTQARPNFWKKQMNLNELLKHLGIKHTNTLTCTPPIQETAKETWERILKQNKNKNTRKQKNKKNKQSRKQHTRRETIANGNRRNRKTKKKNANDTAGRTEHYSYEHSATNTRNPLSLPKRWRKQIR